MVCLLQILTNAYKKEWAEKLCKQIREVDGIIECNVNDATQTFQDVEPFATVEAQSHNGIVGIPVTYAGLAKSLEILLKTTNTHLQMHLIHILQARQRKLMDTIQICIS